MMGAVAGARRCTFSMKPCGRLEPRGQHPQDRDERATTNSTGRRQKTSAFFVARSARVVGGVPLRRDNAKRQMTPP
jgi:hypothetical protein